MSRLRRSLAFGIVIATVTGLAFAQEPREGLVVLEAPVPLEEARAPRPGDVLLHWSRGDASGLLRWPSGLVEVETEQAPRGTVVLRGRRGDRPMSWTMPAALWELRTRPALSEHLLALYQEGVDRFAAREPDKGAISWLTAAREATRADDKPRAAWFFGEIGRALGRERRWSEADSTYQRARNLAQGTGLEAPLLRDWGAMLVQAERWERAELCYRQALDLAPAGSFAAARDRALLASIATHRGEMETAETLYRQALSERARLGVSGPYLVEVARAEIDSFGSPYRPGADREEIAEVRQKLQRLRETLLALAHVPPGAAGSAKTAAASPRKPEPSPLEVLQQALAKAEREAPGSLAVSDRWQDLGTLAFKEGDPVAAEVAWLRALDLREKLAPGTLREARTLHDLARVHAKADRDRAAASFFCRAAAALDRLGRTPANDAATRDALGAEPAAYDQDCVAALVESQRPADAFQALERSRVRGASPSTKEMDADRTQALARLGRLSTSRDRDEVDLLVDYTEELESRRGGIAGPRDLDSVRAALAPGTLLLAWSIGEERSFLFLVRPAEAPGPGVEAFPVRARAGNLRTADLYKQLFGPVDEQIAAAERLLLLPDNVLRALPFGTLVQKPLETAASATAWVAARKDGKDLEGAKDTASP